MHVHMHGELQDPMLFQREGDLQHQTQYHLQYPFEHGGADVAPWVAQQYVPENAQVQLQQYLPEDAQVQVHAQQQMYMPEEAQGQDPWAQMCVLAHEDVSGQDLVAPVVDLAWRGPQPSKGSALHARGRCFPCAHYWKARGCVLGP